MNTLGSQIKSTENIKRNRKSVSFDVTTATIGTKEGEVVTDVFRAVSPGP